MAEPNDQKNYQIETRKHFSGILRNIFGEKSRPISLESKDEIEKFLKSFSSILNSKPDKMGYIWWWRGIRNLHLEKFEFADGFLLMNSFRLMIKSIFVYISAIPRFDFIILNTCGEDIDEADTKNYSWKNAKRFDLDYEKFDENDIDLDIHEFDEIEIRKKLDNEYDYFRLPYIFLLSAQFGMPNQRIFTDTEQGRMLNKLLFNKITYKDFILWYTKILQQLKSRVNRFDSHLRRYPMLGLEDGFGKEITKNLTMLGKHKIMEESYYRARELKMHEPYNEDGMWNPPADKVAIYEGRYNHFGQNKLLQKYFKVVSLLVKCKLDKGLSGV
jgi:hypothetical protein